MISLFLNEICGFQLDNHRWYPLELRKEKATKDESKKDLDMRPNNTDFESKISIVEKEIFSSDEDENSDNDDTSMEIEVNNISDIMKRNATMVEGEVASGSGKKDLQSSKRVAMQNSVSPEIVKPCGRINSCMVVGKYTLYIYGGMMEIRDQEMIKKLRLMLYVCLTLANWMNGNALYRHLNPNGSKPQMTKM